MLTAWLKKMFVPHEGNNHHPHFWKDRTVAVLLIIVLLAELAVLSQSSFTFNKSTYLAAVLPGVLASLTNDQRAASNASPLAENSLLAEAARQKASDMATRGYFAHNTPEGYLPWYWLTRVGYSYDHAGENLAVNFTDSKDVVDAWMNSPTHRANIVKAVYTETGIGMAEGMYEGRPAIFVAQFFGTPKIAAKVAPAVPAVTAVSPAVVAMAPTSTPATRPAPTTVTSTTSIAVATATVAAASTTVPSVAGAESDSQVAEPSLKESLLASPRHTGSTLLLIILAVIVAAFLLILFINGKVHHPRITLLAVAFIVIIIGLLVFNTITLKDKVLVGDEGGSTFVANLSPTPTVTFRKYSSLIRKNI